MWVHVLVWYPIIWCLRLAQGKPVMTRELTRTITNDAGIILTDEPINRCDAKCSAKGKNAGRCLIHRLSYRTGKAILKSNKKESWRVPNRPADVSLTSPDEIGALEISVTSGRKAYEPLGFILVELVSLAESEASGAYEDTQYLLLENNSSENQYVPFSFQCSEIQPDIYEIHLNVWALGHNKADNATDKKYVFDIGPHDPVSSKVFISEGYRKNSKAVNDCACNSKVKTIRLYQDLNTRTIHGSVNVTRFPQDGKLEILLLHTNDYGTVTEEAKWWRNGSGNYTVFRFTERNAIPGKYNVKVKRHCPSKYNILTWCGQDTPVDIVSKDLKLDKSGYPKTPTLRRSNVRLLPDATAGYLKTSTLRHSKVRILPAAIIVAGFAVITVSSFVSAMILIAGIIKLCNDILSKGNKNELRGHRESAEHLLPSPSFNEQESEIEGKNQEATELRFDEIIVPLIYTDDSKEHRDNVYKLRDKLEKCGVTILLADDDSCPEVTSNWVDFTENMAKSYKTFVFVVSPLLFRLCHEGKHGNEKSFQSLIGKTKGIHVPSILLRNLEALDARNWRTPRICLVELTELYYNRIRNLNTRTEDVGSSLATNAATSRVEARAKTVTRSADEVSEFTQEDTLSNKLMIDYNILYNACCFTVPAEDLTEDLGSSRPRALHDLSKWLID